MKKREKIPAEPSGKNGSATPDRLETEMILARLAQPPSKRTGFLRKRLPGGGSFI